MAESMIDYMAAGEGAPAPPIQAGANDGGPFCAECKARLDPKSHDLLPGEECAYPASCRFAIRAKVSADFKPRPGVIRRLEEDRVSMRKVDRADAIDPAHYRLHPSGVECIQITEHMNFCLGNAMKYIWRAGEKGDLVEDLRKARWYIDREIERRGQEPASRAPFTEAG